MKQWRVDLWDAAGALIVSTTVPASDVRDAVDAAWLGWRALAEAGELRRPFQEAARVEVEQFA